MRITTLVENTKISSDLENKHGLSFHIKTDKHSILFDLGPKGVLLDNAKKLGVDLKEVDIVIISHGHSDHGGALEEFLSVNHKASIYVNKEAFNEYYSVLGSFKKYIGLDRELKNNKRIVLVDGDLEIDDELYIFSKIERNHNISKFNEDLYKRVDGLYLEDDFSHEQNLIVKEGNKSLLFSGCAHNDIRNILDKAENIIGKDLDCVISGFHLVNQSTGRCESEEFINCLAETLDKRNTKFYTGHCTGMRPYKILKRKLGDKIDYISTGKIVDL